MSTSLTQLFKSQFVRFSDDYPSAELHSVDTADAYITVSAADYIFIARSPLFYTKQHTRPDQDGPCWIGIPIKVVG